MTQKFDPQPARRGEARNGPILRPRHSPSKATTSTESTVSGITKLRLIRTYRHIRLLAHQLLEPIHDKPIRRFKRHSKSHIRVSAMHPARLLCKSHFGRRDARSTDHK